MKTIEARQVVHRPDMVRVDRDGVALFLDPERGNWIGSDARGAELLELVDGNRAFGEVATLYAQRRSLAPHEAQLHAATFFSHLERRGLIGRERINGRFHGGRDEALAPTRLRELWVHTNNSCNLKCAHCLVGSGPDGDRGLPAERVKDVLDQAFELGVELVFFTGGEPFVRPDLFELIRHATSRARLIILTNGLLFSGKRLEALRACDRGRLGLQISLDGADAASNDPIRGKGTFQGICDGIRTAVREGFDVVVTTAVCRRNAADVPRITRLVAQLGAKTHHLLWPHKRGRAMDSTDDYSLSAQDALETLRQARVAARESGIIVDNWEAFRLRAGSDRSVRYDLSNAGFESMCVYSDGHVYPSAALANAPDLRCGSVLEQPLRNIWLDSPVLRAIRALTVVKKPVCRECPIRFVCGGGDIEHSYAHADSGSGVERMAHLDPYCELYKQSYYDAMEELCRETMRGPKTGFHRPVPYSGRGDGLRVCADEDGTGVALGRSACVLSVDLDAARRPVREFYSTAAEKPQKELCCPKSYSKEDTAHIPQEVLDVFYGCGSPVAIAGLVAGEAVVDLGSGGGIDCFIASKKVGPKGRVYGIDMTDLMLERARRSADIVARRLGYPNVEFRKGYLEEIPLPDRTADVVLSNCVINLSPDKKRVFREMWRVLRNFGRIVVSDIVADRRVPARLENDPEFRGQCLGGALTTEEFSAELERAGFYGITLLEKTYWKEVEGIKFYSVSVRGFKFEKKEGCKFLGQWAAYLGPYQSVMDEEGHLFPRNEAVEVCTDTAAKLSEPPYRDHFVVFDAASHAEFRCCAPGGECC
ncbi:MAG: methyltransferase domain-containing protein [Planctomycetes bacterium]|nr:methyltransferase domain-containing protein [Planctomycetota bacterium]